MKKIDCWMIEETLGKVIDKLLNLEGPENEEDLAKKGGEAIGYFKRDFGIKESGTGRKALVYMVL